MMNETSKKKEPQGGMTNLTEYRKRNEIQVILEERREIDMR